MLSELTFIFEDEGLDVPETMIMDRLLDSILWDIRAILGSGENE